VADRSVSIPVVLRGDQSVRQLFTWSTTNADDRSVYGKWPSCFQF